MASTKRIVTVADLHRSLVTTDKLHIDLVVPGTEVIHKPFPWVFGLAINPLQLKEIVDCSQFADKVHIDLAVEKTVVIRMLLFPPMGLDLVISHLWIVKWIIQFTVVLSSWIEGIIQAVVVLELHLEWIAQAIIVRE